MKNDYLNTLEEGDMLIRDEFELEIDKQRVLFPVESWFDVDKKFGINTQGYDGAWVNLYSTYNPCTNEVKIYFTVDTEDGMFEREYIPTDTEKEVFVKLMEQACEQYTGMTCREFYITEYVTRHAFGFDLECQRVGDMIAVVNRTDDLILYAEETGGKLEKHIGHSIEVATYGGKECIAIECMDCSETLYDTATEELQHSDKQKEVINRTLQPQSKNRWQTLLGKAVCYIGESECGEDLYDTLHNEIGMSNEEISEIGFTSLSEYFESEEQDEGMTMT